MKIKQLLPQPGSPGSLHYSLPGRTNPVRFLLYPLFLLIPFNHYGQTPVQSNGYIQKILEYMGSFYYTNSILYDDSQMVGIGTTSPAEKLDVTGGNIRTDGRFISVAPQGVAPLQVESGTQVNNLNSDLLDGMHAASFAGSNHIHPEMITGSGNATQVAFFNSTGTVTGSPRFFWDSNLDRLGIGTQTPAAKLHIRTSGASSGIRLSEDHQDPHFGMMTSSWDLQNSGGELQFNALNGQVPVNMLRITSLGSSGTMTMNGTVVAKNLRLTQGTTANFILSTNAAGLVISKDPALLTGWTVSGNNVYKINGAASVGTTSTNGMFNIKSSNLPALIVESAAGNGYAIISRTANAQSKALTIEQNGMEKLVVWGDGLLQVDNKIKATEVEVKLNVWQDAVFDQDYPLSSLEDVEAFITTHHHLPGIPSEEEVLSNGISLGEMNALLLQKIEEITLYLIELRKTNLVLEEKLLSLDNHPEP